MTTSQLDQGTRIAMYREMVRARYFEQRTYDLSMEGVVQGTTHLGLGQEAIAAGFAAAMQPTDMTFCTYRGHNHTLLRGAKMSALMGELAQDMGRAKDNIDIVGRSAKDNADVKLGYITDIPTEDPQQASIRHRVIAQRRQGYIHALRASEQPTLTKSFSPLKSRSGFAIGLPNGVDDTAGGDPSV